MPFDPQFALNAMLPLAEAAYDLTKLPKSWTLVSTIEPGDFGFVAQCSQAIAVGIPGTRTEGQWLEDFDGLAVPNRYGKGMVHQGFQDQYALIRSSILAGIQKTTAGLPIWITGHSLGAALAISLQYDLAPVYRTLCYTWAGPRQGWVDFANWFAGLKLECNRIVNEWDVVPRVPSLVNGYKHVGFAVPIDGGRPAFGLDFAKTAHNLELSYRPGIQKLAGAHA